MVEAQSSRHTNLVQNHHCSKVFWEQRKCEQAILEWQLSPLTACLYLLSKWQTSYNGFHINLWSGQKERRYFSTWEKKKKKRYPQTIAVDQTFLVGIIYSVFWPYNFPCSVIKHLRHREQSNFFPKRIYNPLVRRVCWKRGERGRRSKGYESLRRKRKQNKLIKKQHRNKIQRKGLGTFFAGPLIRQQKFQDDWHGTKQLPCSWWSLDSNLIIHSFTASKLSHVDMFNQLVTFPIQNLPE